MVIEEIKLKNFRNYQNKNFSFNPNVNFITGYNGQGKTNLVEGVFYLSNLKSFRISTPKKLIKADQEFAVLQGKILKNNVKQNIKVELRNKGNIVFLNEKKIHLSSEIIQNFFSIVFSPDYISYFKNFPNVRRSFFDRLFSICSFDYFKDLRDYQKAIRQKNILLKMNEIGQVSSWNAVISRLICSLIKKKEAIIDRLNLIMDSTNELLKHTQEKLKLNYKHDFQNVDFLNPDLVSQILESRLKSELKFGFSNIGPHRDKYWISSENGVDTEFFSQGEYRLAFLILNIAVSELIFLKKNNYPIMILDDLFSELDLTISTKIVEFLDAKSNQTFITSTKIPKSFEKYGSAISLEK